MQRLRLTNNVNYAGSVPEDKKCEKICKCFSCAKTDDGRCNNCNECIKRERAVKVCTKAEIIENR